MKLVKKSICLVFCAFLILSLCSCASGRNTFDNAMNALKKSDYDTFSNCIAERPSDFVSSVFTYRSVLTDEYAKAYDSIMDCFNYSYTEKDVKNGDTVILSVKVDHIDFDKLEKDIDADILTSGESVTDEIKKIVENGDIKTKYGLTSEVRVKATKVGNEWLISLNDLENKNFKSIINPTSVLFWLYLYQIG